MRKREVAERKVLRKKNENKDVKAQFKKQDNWIGRLTFSRLSLR